ncbi:uncharacterized protein DUF3105 [Herbihabitans rhizosphaerae]|uniref:Uncharacterized protein DUF3105 n=1 Tax=Herbihabitans rhizosphaerae TaxID=1872711 RepID=A0A4Q7KEA4_9PSEU|nr:DUF3105 domain-containing protein [Herbihabitans rhizosphaerae]RZS32401.1 uncharacterized protein DUF3105 [Herbihabitans rhizosphaerae]
MASGTKNKSVRAARASVVANKPKPWGTIFAVIAVVLLAGGVFGYAYVQISDSQQFKVSEDNKDPSENIEGVVRTKYEAGKHVKGTQRVIYDQSPPFGGPHDEAWADCTGVVYKTAVRNENMVHSLEHGSVWIAYNPDQIKDAAVDKLKSKVEGQPYMIMSPYPGLDKPIALSSWGHQLKLDNPDDERVDQFIKSLRQNQYQNPEPRGSCDSPGPPYFDPAAPPPFDPAPPPPGSVSMDGKGAFDNPGQNTGMGTPQVPPGGQQPPAGQPPAGQPPAGQPPAGQPPANR